MLPFLCNDLVKLIKHVMPVIVKPDVINQCNTAPKLLEIDLSKMENLLSAKNMNIGFVASTHIEKLIKNDADSKTMITDFKKSVKVFVTATVHKLVEKSPIGSSIVRNTSASDPNVIHTLSNENLIR